MLESIQARPRKIIGGFIDFIRERGVIGLAIGFLIGGAVTKLVASLVGDILNPVIGLALGRAADLKSAAIRIGDARIMWGNFLSNFLDFVLIAMVVYFGFKALRLDKLDKPKE